MGELGMIGAKRLEYLDLANKSFSSGNYSQANAFLESFMTTVRDESSMAKDIAKEFDSIEKKKMETWNATVVETEKMDSWTQSETRDDARTALSLAVLQDKIDCCWKVAMSHGAFND